MNFKNKYAVVTVRTLLGLLFIFSGASGLWAGTHNMEVIPTPMLANTNMLWVTGIFQMIKVTEIIAGLMLVIGVLPALATIFLSPIGIGVIVVNSRTAPDFLVMGVIVCAGLAYLGYAQWDKYKQLFEKTAWLPR